MKHLSRKVIAFTTLCIALQAQATPAQVDPKLQKRVDQLITSLQTQAPHHVSLEFINWEEAFRNVEASRREALGISSPAALKRNIATSVRDPLKALEHQFEKDLRNYGPEQRALLKDVFDKRVRALRTDWQKVQSEMVAGRYILKHLSIDPKNEKQAHVVLSKAKDRDIEPLAFNFEKLNEEWYIVADIEALVE